MMARPLRNRQILAKNNPRKRQTLNTNQIDARQLSPCVRTVGTGGTWEFHKRGAARARSTASTAAAGVPGESESSRRGGDQSQKSTHA